MVLDKAVNIELALKAGLSIERFPENDQEQDRAEEIIAETIRRMSIEDHEKAIFDIHGIVPDREETEPLIQTSLNELEQELRYIDKKDAYDYALFLNPSYVKSRAFRLLFLRCENFNAANAAQSMVYHFDLKRDLFGESDILAREVYQSDLDQEDMGVLKYGISQLLPKTDAGGRFVTVTSCDHPYGGDNPMKSLRPFWYAMMARLRNEELQKKGTVNIVWHSQPVSFSLEYYKHYNRLEVAVPTRIVVDHFCRPKEINRDTELGFRLFASRSGLVRYKVHRGTLEEIRFSLQTYGLPVEDIPGRPDGTLRVEAHQAWVEAMRKQEEESFHTDSNIVIPRPQDILFGKHSRARDHPGNVKAQSVVDEHFEEYEKADKLYKSVVVEKIVLQIQQSGGRFLKQRDDGGGLWEQVADLVAKQKVGHWCRHLRQKSKKCSDILDTSDETKQEEQVAKRRASR